MWDELDVSADPTFRLLVGVPGRLAVLMGAFDPPTLAHLDVVRAAARMLDARPTFCLTKVLLDRPDAPLLSPTERLGLLADLGREHRIGVAIANRGTYVDVSDAASRAGCDASFVIGSDKLAQLEDPRFYPDGTAGVERTFRDVSFVVVLRGGDGVGDRRGVRVLEDAFSEPAHAAISATEVRRRVGEGRDVNDLVPPLVARALRGYTGSTERG